MIYCEKSYWCSPQRCARQGHWDIRRIANRQKQFLQEGWEPFSFVMQGIIHLWEDVRQVWRMHDSLKCFHEWEVGQVLERSRTSIDLNCTQHRIHIWFSFATLYFFRGGYKFLRTISCRSLLLYRVSVVLYMISCRVTQKASYFLLFCIYYWNYVSNKMTA